MALDDPSGQKYPAAQGPLHPLVAIPGDAPYSPAGHGPLQVPEVRLEVVPYRPTPHCTHAPSPPVL